MTTPVHPSLHSLSETLHGAIRNYGTKVISELYDVVLIGHEFNTATVEVPCLAHLTVSSRAQYIHAIMHNFDRWAWDSEDPPCFVRTRATGRWWKIDH